MEEAKQTILPFDALYRGKTIFPTREDGSIFLSLAAFREHLLAVTLKDAYSKVVLAIPPLSPTLTTPEPARARPSPLALMSAFGHIFLVHPGQKS